MSYTLYCTKRSSWQTHFCFLYGFIKRININVLLINKVIIIIPNIQSVHDGEWQVDTSVTILVSETLGGVDDVQTVLVTGEQRSFNKYIYFWITFCLDRKRNFQNGDAS